MIPPPTAILGSWSGPVSSGRAWSCSQRWRWWGTGRRPSTAAAAVSGCRRSRPPWPPPRRHAHTRGVVLPASLLRSSLLRGSIWILSQSVTVESDGVPPSSTGERRLSYLWHPALRQRDALLQHGARDRAERGEGLPAGETGHRVGAGWHARPLARLAMGGTAI